MLHRIARFCHDVDTLAMNVPPDAVHACPYCRRPLHWVPQRWFGRGTFECERCGEFPDLAEPTHHVMPTVAVPLDASRPRPPRRQDGRPRVLLVDDSAEYRDLYAVMLEQTATVITASRGEDALTIAREEPVDAIVLDVMMPGMDGWQTCQQLKSNPQTSTIPVIMLTSLDGLGVPETAARVGATSVLIKPCAVERLAFAIKEALH
jgi:CheY-like chemotaxis protein